MTIRDDGTVYDAAAEQRKQDALLDALHEDAETFGSEFVDRCGQCGRVLDDQYECGPCRRLRAA